jgi:SnoaL-like domain
MSRPCGTRRGPHRTWIDGKQYQLLGDVFTEDVEADYGPFGRFSGLPPSPPGSMNTTLGSRRHRT